MTQKAPGKSHRQGLTLLDLNRQVPTDLAAREWFENIRWADGRYCPHCGSSENTYRNLSEKPMAYHCGVCRQHFSVKTGTVMEASKIGLQKWVACIFLLSTNLKGVSSMELHRDLGVTQKTAWMMAQKIREGWTDGSDQRARVC